MIFFDISMIFNNKSIRLKNSNELEDLLNLIQSRTSHTMAMIAQKLGRSPEHIIRLKKESPEKAQRTIRLLKEKYKEELKEDRIFDADKIKAIDATLSVLIAEVASLKSERTGEPVQSIIMRLQKSSQDVLKMGS